MSDSDKENPRDGKSRSGGKNRSEGGRGRSGTDRPRYEAKGPRRSDDRPRAARPPRERAEAGDGPKRPFRGKDRDFRPRDDGEGERRPRPRRSGDGERAFSTRPPRRDEDRPRRPFDRAGEGRPPRERDREERPAKRRFDRDAGDRAASDQGGRKPSGRKFGGDGPGGDRPRQDKPFRDRNFRDKPSGDRPFRARSPEASTGDKPFRRKPQPEGEAPRRFDRDRRDEGGAPREGDARPGRFARGPERAFERRDRPGRDDARPPRRDDRPPRDFDRRPAPAGDGRLKRPRRDEAIPAAGTPGLAEGGERIARVIARAGLCSRREAEEWIEAGRVNVNGTIIDSPALDIGPHDRVFVDGKPLPERERTRLWLFHKPRGLVTTASDPEGRPTVFDNLPPGLPRVMSVGRLDINTEGLMLLTNDGGLAKVLAHPETGWLRRYRVRVHGHVEQAALDSLREGISLDGVDYGPIGATLEREVGDNAWLTIDLREGKNREIKRVLEHLGLMVNRLIRVSFGPFQLEDLGESAAEEVRTKTLKDQLGARLIEQANAWFEGPRRDSVAETQAMLAPTPPKPKRFDRRKPGEKRDLAILGEAPELKVSREKVADRRGRNVQVERITRVEAAEEPAPVREEKRGRPFRARDDRPPRREGDRPFKQRPPRDGDAPRGERPYRARPEGDRPPRREGDRPFRPRPPKDGDAPRGERPYRARPEGDRPPRRDGDRPFKPRPPRDGDRPFSGKPGGPGGGKPFGGRPSGGRPGGGKRPPRGDR